MTNFPRVAALVAAALLTIGLSACQSDDGYGSMSCAELSGEMATMTGDDATLADYDVDKVQEINDARQDKGCRIL